MSDHHHAGSPADAADTAAAAIQPHAGPSRRSILWSAAGAGAAGLAAAAMARTAPAFAAATPAASRIRPPDAPTTPAPAGGPVVVHLRNARSGEMDVFAGTTRTRLRDPDLAARLARAAR
jgi:hypothetical protein